MGWGGDRTPGSCTIKQLPCGTIMSPSFSSHRRPGATSLFRELRGTLRLPASSARNSYRVSLSEERPHAATEASSAGAAAAGGAGGAVDEQHLHLQMAGQKEKHENGLYGTSDFGPQQPQQHHYHQHLQTHLNQEIPPNQNGLSNKVSEASGISKQ